MSRRVQISSAIALGLALCSVAVDASATKPKAPKSRPPVTKAVPEISGQHAGVGLALALGGAAVVLGRRRKTQAR